MPDPRRAAALLALSVMLSAPSPVEEAPAAVQEALPEGGPYPTLLIPQAWFWEDASGRPVPGPARLLIWQQTAEGWVSHRLEDADSNVFHEAWFYGDGLLTIGAEGATLKRWTRAEGAWTGEVLWTREWRGRFDRLREMELGDVDHDGQDEIVIATHDSGVVAVFEPETRAVTELDERPDTFVHEVEIGDIDGDGKAEFFATPTERARGSREQPGELVMYRWDGTTYQRTVVARFADRHAKEILVTDLDGDGRDELLAVVEAAVEGREIVSPVEIRQYDPSDASGGHTVLATIADRQARFLVPADYDRDGQVELIVGAMRSGLWGLDRDHNGAWQPTLIDAASSGFEHSVTAADLDGDGWPELYVAADDQQELRRYTWSAEAGRLEKTVLGALPHTSISWGVAAGRF